MSAESIEGVDVEELERVFELLRNRLPQVFKANRYFEERTGFHNQAGTNNIVDAVSHFATLIEKAEELGKAGQAEQVAHLEDHLRRSMMEAFEQTLKFVLSDVAELWDQYLDRVYPLLARGTEVPGAASIEVVEEKRTRITSLLDEGRESKREITWEAWQEGTGALIEACDEAEALAASLQESIAAANHLRKERRSHYLLAGGSLLFLVIGFLLGHFV